MSSIAKSLTALSPDKRAVLTQKLKDSASDYGLFPLSFAQERLWFLDQLVPGNPNYNMPAVLYLEGQLDIGSLEQSLSEIVRRHETLRTAFVNVNGRPMQQVMSEHRIALPIIDLSGLESGAQRVEMERLVLEEARRPFDLEEGHLLRGTLLRLSDNHHVLAVTLHHIASDDWSHSVFMRELSMLYQVFTQGKDAGLPELPFQYADFAVWQREWLQGERFEALLEHWRTQLDGAPDLLALPFDRPRPAVQSFKGARKTFSLSRELTQKLKALGREHDATLFMTLQSAFSVLLGRYSDQDDLLIGTPIANRNRAELEGLIGLFFNTLVMRMDLSGDPSFTGLLGRTRETALRAYAHQDLPFVKLVEELHPERALSHNPLVQVMFILQNAPKQELQLPGLTLSHEDVDNHTAQLDLIVSMWEEGERLTGYAHFDTDLFDVSTIERMLGHFEVLLEQVASRPTIRLSRLSIVTQVERDQILRSWNDTTAVYPDSACLHQLFEQQVDRQPDTVAAIAGNQKLSYRELDIRSNQLAGHLRSLGVGPDVAVGICVGRSLNMVVGMMGILKAGGAYVPLDPAYPEARLAFMLDDSDVRVLVTEQRLLDQMPAHSAQAVCLDSEWNQIAQRGVERLDTDVDTENLAYVIYTSGTTGQPKGVMIRHGGIVNNLVDLNQCFQVTASDRVLALSSFSFDMCVYEVFGILAAGGAVVVPEALRARDPAHWVDLILEHRVTIWNSAPALLEMLVHYAAGNAAPKPHHLRVAILGGDWVDVTLPDRLKGIVPSMQFIVLGGATEASIHSIIYPVEKTDSDWTSIPYGRPMVNQQAYLLDSNLNLVPVGVPGELYLGGVGLARGYLAKPKLTAERFVPSPFAHEPGERVYRTGDLARYRRDGVIELIGRIDHQVKIRGHRIELGEIEAVLKAHEAVKDVAVVARGDAKRERHLVAYWVLKPQESTDPTVLCAYLKSKLPVYMVPKTFVLLDKLPLTPNGKVDRRSLPDPDQASAVSRAEYAAPETPLQEALVAIFTQVTGTERVGIHDNFFDVGGHSLRATQAMSLVRDMFQVELPLSKFFEASTVSALAEALEEEAATQGINIREAASVLNQLNRMTEDEAKALLAQKQSN